jgi:hypothetical protein
MTLGCSRLVKKKKKKKKKRLRGTSFIRAQTDGEERVRSRSAQ